MLEDWDFFLRLAREYTFHHIPQCTAEYRLRDDGTNLSLQKPWMSVEEINARTAIYQRYRQYRGPRYDQWDAPPAPERASAVVSTLRWAGLYTGNEHTGNPREFKNRRSAHFLSAARGEKTQSLERWPAAPVPVFQLQPAGGYAGLLPDRS